MKKYAAAVAVSALIVSSGAMAQTTVAPVQTTVPPAHTAPRTVASETSAQLIAELPTNNKTVTDYYKQDVYDPNNSKIGSIDDVLIDSGGRVTAVIVGVGGFLGVGEKDVAVPFSSLHIADNNNKPYLVMNTTKDALKSAPGYKYDSRTTSWVPDNR